MQKSPSFAAIAKACLNFFLFLHSSCFFFPKNVRAVAQFDNYSDRVNQQSDIRNQRIKEKSDQHNTFVKELKSDLEEKKNEDYMKERIEQNS